MLKARVARDRSLRPHARICQALVWARYLSGVASVGAGSVAPSVSISVAEVVSMEDAAAAV